MTSCHVMSTQNDIAYERTWQAEPVRVLYDACWLAAAFPHSSVTPRAHTHRHQVSEGESEMRAGEKRSYLQQGIFRIRLRA